MDNEMNKNNQKCLWALCEKFIKDNKISCPEAIYQCDHIAEHSYDFIHEITKIVGFQNDD